MQSKAHSEADRSKFHNFRRNLVRYPNIQLDDEEREVMDVFKNSMDVYCVEFEICGNHERVSALSAQFHLRVMRECIKVLFEGEDNYTITIRRCLSPCQG